MYGPRQLAASRWLLCVGGVAVGLAISAAVREATGLKIGSQYKSVMTIGTEDAAKAAPTQGELAEHLNKWCKTLFDELCATHPSFCNLTAVALKDVGTKSQREKAWRCYASSEFDNSLSSGSCVTDCGEEFPCGGVKGGRSSNHSTVRDIEVQIQQNVVKYCKDEGISGPGKLQEKLDKFCGGQSEEGTAPPAGQHVARKQDLNSAGADPKMKEWGCFSAAHPGGPKTALCVTDCGVEVECEEGLWNPSSSNRMSLKESLTAIIAEDTPAFCEANSVARGERLKVRLLAGGSLQLSLNDHCSKLFAELCGQNKPEFCVSRALARRDIGKGDWSCYALEGMQPTERGSLCLDDCGKAIPCFGALGNATGVPVPDLQMRIAEGTARSCPATQQAAQQVCDKAVPSDSKMSLLARKSQGGWSCIPHSDMNYEASGTCFGGCGEETACSGGPSENAADSSHVEAPGVQAAADGVFLCHPGATCKMQDGKALCVFDKQLSLGNVGTVEVSGLHTNFILWLGVCVGVEINRGSSGDRKLYVSIQEGGRTGGFILKSDGEDLAVSIAKSGDMDSVVEVRASTARGGGQVEGRYVIRGLKDCAKETALQYVRVPKSVGLALTVTPYTVND